MARYQRNNLSCAICRHKQNYRDILYVNNTVTTTSKFTIRGNYSAKIAKIVEVVLEIREKEHDVKIVIFSSWDQILSQLAAALLNNRIKYVTKSSERSFHASIESFKNFDKSITCLLLPLTLGSKGLNLIEATHVFLVEPILDDSEEKQAVGRVHRIGQTRPTFVHRFIMLDTIEETIHETCANWDFKKVTIQDLERLFELKEQSAGDDFTMME